MVNFNNILLNLFTKMIQEYLLKILQGELLNSPQDEPKIRFLNDLIQKLQSELSEFTEEEKKLLNKLKLVIEKIEDFDIINKKISEFIANNSKIFEECNNLNKKFYLQLIKCLYVHLRMFYSDLKPCKGGGARGFNHPVMIQDINDFIKFSNLTSNFFSVLFFRQKRGIYAKCCRRIKNFWSIQEDIERTQFGLLREIKNISLKNLDIIVTLINDLHEFFNELELLKKGKKSENREIEDDIGMDEIYSYLSKYKKNFEIFDEFLEKNANLVEEFEKMTEEQSRTINYGYLFQEAVKCIHFVLIPLNNKDITERFCQFGILRHISRKCR